MSYKLTEDKLTAYVLNELDPKERKIIEAEIRDNPILKKEIAAIRTVCGMLANDFKNEPVLTLSPAQKKTVREGDSQHGNVSARKKQNFSFGFRLWVPLAAAAVVMVVTVPKYLKMQDPTSVSRLGRLPEVQEMDKAIGPKASDEEAEQNRSSDTAKSKKVNKDEGEAQSKLSNPAAKSAVTGDAKEVAFVPASNDGTEQTFDDTVGASEERSKNRKESLNLPEITSDRGRHDVQDMNPAPTEKSPVGLQKYVKAPPPSTNTKGMANAGRGQSQSSYGLGSPGAGSLGLRGSENKQQPNFFGAGSGGVAHGVNLSQLGTMDSKSEGKRSGLSRRQAGVGADKLSDRRIIEDQSIDGEAGNTEAYDHIVDNPFYLSQKDPLSTFSIDVDTASYANMRRFLLDGQKPPKDSIRIEEMINYFGYDYAGPTNERPFSVDVEIGEAPWEKTHRLVKIGIQGKKIDWGKRPASNLVFLLDVSGSMQEATRLPLLKESLKMLVENLGERDRVAIVVYAGASGVVLNSTAADQKTTIMDALDKLMAGGSTNGGSGITLAYKIAQDNFVKDGINRVILATDGDFNVGTTNEGDLTRLIEQKAKTGVFLTVLGFGMGNIKDSTLEKLADKGNGNYGYIDSIAEAKKLLVEQAGGTMITIAKDVKIQVEFNPEEVSAYRLIGYENRILKHQDFNNDKIDAGEIGSGHSVTALYEVVPKGVKVPVPGTDALKYQAVSPVKSGTGELLTLKLRYKEPKASTSNLIEAVVKDSGKSFAATSDGFKFASAVAEFGMLLRESEYKGSATFASTLQILEDSAALKGDSYKQEFLSLVKKAQGLWSSKK
jgi:Ca-activated chloride channel family protein